MENKGMILSELTITDSIKLRITDAQRGNNERAWYLTVIYDDNEEIEFTSINVIPVDGNDVIEAYVFDENYIYTYYENGYKADDVISIFDLRRKREVTNSDEKDIIYSEFLAMQNLNLNNIRERNRRLEKENQRIRE